MVVLAQMKKKKIWKYEKTTLAWKKGNLNLLLERMSGWQLETFKASYEHKSQFGISLFKKGNPEK